MHKTSFSVGVENGIRSVRTAFETHPPAVWAYLIGGKRFLLFSDWSRKLPVNSRSRSRYLVVLDKTSYGSLDSSLSVSWTFKPNKVGVFNDYLNSGLLATCWEERYAGLLSVFTAACCFAAGISRPLSKINK